MDTDTHPTVTPGEKGPAMFKDLNFLSKLFAIVLSIIYVLVVVVGSGGHLGSINVVLVLIPINCLILFPDQVGEYTGFVSLGRRVDAPSPAPLVSLLGWMFLIGLPILIYFLNE